MSSHNYDTTFTHDIVRPGRQQEPIKTGSIIINRQDTLPQYQDQIHTDPRTHETYANLKPWSQIQDEQGGIVHSTGSSSSYNMMSMSTPMVRFDERPVTNAPPSRTYSRQFNLEFARQKPDEDVMKTGGIVINPSDVHSSQRSAVQRDPKSGVSYAMLKPWEQIQEQQYGIVHSMPQHFGPTRIDEIDHSREKKAFHKAATVSGVSEPVKYGGILIDPEDMLPSRREGIQDQMVGRDPMDRSHYEILHRAKTEVGHTQQRDLHLTPSQPADIVHVPGAHTTRKIRPEDMLPWMRDYSKDGQVPYPLNRILVDRQLTMDEGPTEIMSRKEDAMPLRRAKPEKENQDVGKVVTALRQKNSGSSYVELNRTMPEMEPVKTGGILVNPRDMHTSQRLAVQPVPNSNLSFVQLKPWNQIQEQQSGIIHSNSVQVKPSRPKLSTESRKNNKSLTASTITIPREAGLNDIENFDRLNPQTRELLNSHARSRTMNYSSRDVAKPNEWVPMTESVMLPTQSTLNDLDARLDTLLSRSRTAINEASRGGIQSFTSLDENAGNYQSETGYKGTSLGAF